MTVEHLRRLWQLALPDVSVIPQSGEHCEPLAAIYTSNAQYVARQSLDQGRLSLQSFAHELVQMKRARIYHVGESERRLYRNVNSPEDLL
jgi:molybdopterin-guanine dinucleotide biosynthesis protein A